MSFCQSAAFYCAFRVPKDISNYDHRPKTSKSVLSFFCYVAEPLPTLSEGASLIFCCTLTLCFRVMCLIVLMGKEFVVIGVEAVLIYFLKSTVPNSATIVIRSFSPQCLQPRLSNFHGTTQIAVSFFFMLYETERFLSRKIETENVTQNLLKTPPPPLSSASCVHVREHSFVQM